MDIYLKKLNLAETVSKDIIGNDFIETKMLELDSKQEAVAQLIPSHLAIII